MKTALIVDTTEFVTIDNNAVPVKSLPEAIRNEIKTLDAYRQSANELAFELEKYQILTQVKTAQVESLLKEWVAANASPAPEVN